MGQIDSWRSYEAKNRDFLLRELSKLGQSNELVCGHDEEPLDTCGWPLYHPKSWLHWHYHIVIGRRGDLSDDDMSKKASFLSHHDIEIMTYDRLLDAAEKLDALEKEAEKRVFGRICGSGGTPGRLIMRGRFVCTSRCTSKVFSILSAILPPNSFPMPRAFGPHRRAGPCRG